MGCERRCVPDESAKKGSGESGEAGAGCVRVRLRRVKAGTTG